MGQAKKDRTKMWEVIKGIAVNNCIITEILEEQNFSRLVRSGVIRRAKNSDLRIQV